MCKDHLGNKYSTIAEMCRAYNISYQRYYQRRHSGWSIEKALTEPLIVGHHHETIDHTGKTFLSKSDMCDYYNIDLGTYRYRIAHGLSLEEALTMPVNETKSTANIWDHKGNAFSSARKMCEYWGVSYPLYRQMKRHGYSNEDILEKKKPYVREKNTHNGRECVDHLGNKYPSIADMCRHYGIRRGTYRCRMERGWSLEDTLTKELRKNNSKKCVDPNGKEYPNIKTLCKAWNIPYNIYIYRIKTGMSCEEALTTPVQNKRHTWTKPVTDPFGNHFDSTMEMYGHYGLTRACVWERMRRGMSLADALTTPVQKPTGRKKKEYVDHKGIAYEGLDELCNAYGISQSTYCQRRGRGWSLEETLEGNKNLEKCTDHLGTVYHSVSEMCRVYNISQPTFISRIRRGMSVEKALTTPVRKINRRS